MEALASFKRVFVLHVIERNPLTLVQFACSELTSNLEVTKVVSWQEFKSQKPLEEVNSCYTERDNNEEKFCTGL